MRLNNYQIEAVCSKLKLRYISHKFLSFGAHNAHYLIKVKKHSKKINLVIRISCYENIGSLKREYKILKSTKGKFGPVVYLYDDTRSIIETEYIVEEFINGPLIQREKNDSISNNFIETMAQFYSELHRKKYSVPKILNFSGKYSLKKTIDYHFLRRFQRTTGSIKNTLKEEIENLITIFINYTDTFQNDYFNVKHVCLIQGDPTEGNVFYWEPNKTNNKAKVKLIDWEFARYDLPEFDLSFFMDTYDLTHYQQNYFLNKYKFPNDEIYRKRLQIVWLCHIYRIIAWRLERLALIRREKINNNLKSTQPSALIDGIKGGLHKARTRMHYIGI